MTSMEADPLSGAWFSPCRRWRYALWRTWGAQPPVVFIGLNPSTADEQTDDPTIRRCVDFAKRWGGGLVMINAFAWRSTDPAALYEVVDPVGPGNDAAIVSEATRAQLVCAAWGVHGELRGRGRVVCELLRDNGVTLHRLGATKTGYPRHPLYMRADTVPEVWA